MEQIRENQLKIFLKDLRKAVASLNDVFKRPSNDKLRDRDAAIQRFEYTFERSWESMKLLAEEEGIDCPSPKEHEQLVDSGCNFGCWPMPLPKISYISSYLQDMLEIFGCGSAQHPKFRFENTNCSSPGLDQDSF